MVAVAIFGVSIGAILIGVIVLLVRFIRQKCNRVAKRRQ